MKGDLSRDTFDAGRHYSSVRLQQGRILTDADWNEQADITQHRAERQALDIIGECGAPEAAAGFALAAGTYPLAVAAVADAAWMAGDGGIALQTADAGLSWIVQDTGTTRRLRAVRFVDATTGWMAGDDGTLLHTLDGGTTWTPQSAATTAALYGLAAVDASRAWAVGSGGVVVRTTDGGVTWTVDQAGTGLLYAVHFASSAAGWIAGQGGQLLATTDGGATWTPQSSGTTAHLRAIAFANASTGWAVGDRGTILRTADGGASWTAQSSFTSITLRAVAFADANEGWAAGDDGVLLHTTDGGAVWTHENTGSTASLRGLALATAGLGWAVGDESTLLRLGSGSPTIVAEPLPATGLSFSAGRFYAGGILLENESRVSYYAQPDRIAPDRLVPGTHIVFLDVWQRHISALEDPYIREVALGGPDTATRAKTVWQIRTLPLGPGSPALEVNCLSQTSEWDALTTPGPAFLRARAEPQPPATSLCEIAATAGNRNDENQFYRIEIQEAGPGNVARFKWSRENASVAHAITGIARDAARNETIVTLASRGLDDNLDLAVGDQVEIVDDAVALENGVGAILELLREGDDPLEIVLSGLADESLGHPDRHPLIRRWEQRPAGTDATLLVEEGRWIPLEEGIEVWFEPGGDYRTAMFWWLPARTITGDVEWPRDEHGDPIALPPEGVDHHYCRLGLIDVAGDGTIAVLSDCRPIFPPLTQLSELLYVSGDGQDAIPGRELPQPLRVRVTHGGAAAAGARVRFTIENGGGSLAGAPPGQPLDVTVSADGLAEARWTLGADVTAAASHQRVRASRLDGASQEIADQIIVFCATASALLSYVSGDGQEGPGSQPLPHPLEVRVSNSQRPMQGARVRFSVTQGGGNLIGTNPVTTGADGLAAIDWQLSASGTQRVVAEWIDAGDNPVQHLAFNARVVSAQAGDDRGCDITVGERGQVRELSTETLTALLEEFGNRVCLCFLAQERPHVIRDLQVSARGARVSLHGCGHAATVVLATRAMLNGFASVDLSRLHFQTEGDVGFLFSECGEVSITSLDVERETQGREPFLRFAAIGIDDRVVGRISITDCRISNRGRGLDIVFEDANAVTHLSHNDIDGIVSFYGISTGVLEVNATALLQRMLQPAVLEPAAGTLHVDHNTFGMVAVGEEMENRINAFIQSQNQPLQGLYRTAQWSGNTIGRSGNLFVSTVLTLTGTSFTLEERSDPIAVFLALTATATGNLVNDPGDTRWFVITQRGRFALRTANVGGNLVHN